MQTNEITSIPLWYPALYGLIAIFYSNTVRNVLMKGTQTLTNNTVSRTFLSSRLGVKRADAHVYDRTQENKVN